MLYLYEISVPLSISVTPISAPVLFKKPTPSQINLIKDAKNHFLLLKRFKNTESAQLCVFNPLVPKANECQNLLFPLQNITTNYYVSQM